MSKNSSNDGMSVEDKASKPQTWIIEAGARRGDFCPIDVYHHSLEELYSLQFFRLACVNQCNNVRSR